MLQVKVPKFLAEKIAQADRDGIPLGTMLIDANENITLQLEDRDGVEDAIPQNYKIKITNENVKNEYFVCMSYTPHSIHIRPTHTPPLVQVYIHRVRGQGVRRSGYALVCF